jgi:hypothetical protein
VTPSDQTSAFRVSCGRPRARSGERYYRKSELVLMVCQEISHLRSTIRQVAMKRCAGFDIVLFSEAKINKHGYILGGKKDVGRPKAIEENRRITKNMLT